MTHHPSETIEAPLHHVDISFDGTLSAIKDLDCQGFSDEGLVIAALWHKIKKIERQLSHEEEENFRRICCDAHMSCGDAASAFSNGDCIFCERDEAKNELAELEDEED